MADKKITQLASTTPSGSQLMYVGDPITGKLYSITVGSITGSAGGNINTGSLLLSSSFNSYTSSNDLKVNNVYASESKYTLTSSFNTFSSSYVVDSGSFNTRINSITGSSIINVDGTLTISNNTASLNLSSSNTWTGVQTFATSSKLVFKSVGLGSDMLAYNPGGGAVGYSAMDFYPTGGVNLASNIAIIPKGTGQLSNKAGLSIFATDFVANSSNYEFFTLTATGVEYSFSSQASGTGTFRPLNLYVGTSNKNQLYLNSAGKVLIGTSTDNGVNLLQVSGSVNLTSINMRSGSNASPREGDIWFDTTGSLKVYINGSTKGVTLS